MNIELVTEREKLTTLAGRWNELAQTDTRDGFFRTYEWYRSWMEHIRPDAQPFVIVIRNADGKVVGLAPLCRICYRDLGFRLTGISWAGREVVSGDFLDVVSENQNKAAVTSAIFEHLWRLRSQWSLLVMSELIEGSDCRLALEKWAEENGLALRRQEERICPYIALPNTFEKYLEGLGSSTRYHIRRRIRDAEKRGAQIAIYSQPAEVTSRLDTLTRLHLARWSKDHLPGTLSRPGFTTFLKQICSSPPASSSSRLYVLTHDGSPIAALLTFCFGRSALYYQAGWNPDPAVAALSPGVVLMAHSIRDAIEHGLSYYEFLRGDEAYKSRWAHNHRKTATFLLAEKLLAREYLRVARLKDALKSRLTAKQIQMVHTSEHGVEFGGPHAAA